MLWQFGLVVGLDQQSYSTSGPVNAWMCDRLRTGKPSRYVTSHSGQLSLAVPLWVGTVSTCNSWGVNRHTVRYTSPYLWSRRVSWCLAEGQGNGDQRHPMGHLAREGLYLLTYINAAGRTFKSELLLCSRKDFALFMTELTAELW